jgi:predicted transcriptional regulator
MVDHRSDIAHNISKVLKMHKAGMSNEKIAEQLGISEITVYYYVKLGILLEKERELEEKESQLRELEERILKSEQNDYINEKIVEQALSELKHAIFKCLYVDNDIKSVYELAVELFGESGLDRLLEYHFMANRAEQEERNNLNNRLSRLHDIVR